MGAEGEAQQPPKPDDVNAQVEGEDAEPASVDVPIEAPEQSTRMGNVSATPRSSPLSIESARSKQLDGSVQTETASNTSGEEIPCTPLAQFLRSPQNARIPSHNRQAAEHTSCPEEANEHLQTSYATAINLIHLFLDKIQPWMPIFHRPNFLKFCGQALDNNADDVLQYLDLQDRLLYLGIFAMSARFSTTLDPSVKASERGQRFARQAKKIYDIARDEVEPNLTFLQGCILLSFHYYTSGLSAQGWVTVGVCVRMAYALGLHEIDGDDLEKQDEGTSLDPVEIERRRRVWWLVWELDCFGSTVLQRPFAIDQRRWTVRLPMTDDAWFCGPDEYCALLTWEPGQLWKVLIGIGAHNERACFLVANVLLSLIVDRCQQKRGVSVEEKILLENDVACVVLALPSAFDLNTQPPTFDNTSFARCNWILGTHLLLAASTCLAAGIRASESPTHATSPQTTLKQSTGLAHMLRLATIIRNWSPDYISLAHPFLAYSFAPVLGSEPASVRSSPTYPSFHDLATLVQRRFAEKWKVGDVALGEFFLAGVGVSLLLP